MHGNASKKTINLENYYDDVISACVCRKKGQKFEYLFSESFV